MEQAKKRIIRKVKPAAAMPRLERVAAYCRVSSGKDAMLHSLSAQVSHYSELIQRRPGWAYAGVYADEALTGTKDDRPEFQRLLVDCRAGKIGRVLTKSVSRFARNTVTLLETVRELKKLGVAVYFEEQNIDSLSGDGELMLTILASFAQEESKSVSDNCKWRIRKDFSEGKPMNLPLLYGYRRKGKGVEIDPKEADVVRRVFSEYLSGNGSPQIAARLQSEGIPRRLGGAWTATAVREMLSNEKYTGDALLQKTYIENHLSKKTMRNRGELPQYYAENTHPAIIDHETYEKVQTLIAIRWEKANVKKDVTARYPFTGMIVCGCCGAHYNRRTRSSGRGTPQRITWQCVTYSTKGKKYCTAKQIPEKTLYCITREVLGVHEIVTKSVSRFARNTVDTLTTIRKLKEKGVGVTFEKENIDTLDSKGELLITIMSSLAQEESRSISENVTWGWRKRISDGKVSVAYSHFLGYEKGEDGSMQVVESEAKIVRQIYGMFLDGQTPSSIAAFLTKQRIPTPAGKEKWQSSTVKSILTNEKYKGDALLQKTFTVDFLSKKAKINEGEVPQYYVEKSHPAIVSAEVFDLAQYEMKRRAKKGRHTSATSIFSDKLVCGECGAVYGSKVWHSTDAYRTMIWRCNEKYAVKGQPCPSPHLRDEEIQNAFVQAVNQVLAQKEEILSTLQEVLVDIADTSSLERECERLQAEQDAVSQQMSRMIRENAEVAQNQAEYNARLQPLEERYEALNNAMLRKKEAISEQTGRRRRLEAFMRGLRENSLLTAFDERVFLGTVERITVFQGASKGKKRLAFRFKDGRNMAVTL